MIWTPEVGDLIKNKHTERIGIVYEVSVQWGWFRVRYSNKTNKKYVIQKGMQKTLRKLTAVEKADYYLNRENIGLTDSWRE